jgi:hypothetical protein
MAISPQYAATVKSTISQISTANTSRDGSGTTVLAFSSGTNGSRIEKIQIKALGNTTSGMIRFFISSNGTDRSSSYCYNTISFN